MVNFMNPVIPGFYPDPSVCRVGSDYFLVNSSFEFFPGIPLFHSRDLIHWEQIGHVLTRKSQAVLEDERASKGIWAPTIRENKGRFYVSATNMSYGGNFFVYTDDIYGEWSEPIWVKQGGIDPSLFFDADGQVYFASTYDMPGGQAIGQSRIDIETGELLTDTKIIWEGSGGKYPEGPHMFVKDGWYYLLVAEGGTFINHSVQMARCRTINGDYEICPRNPILTHRHMPVLNPISVTGHADIVETQNGEWWMVLLAVRPYEGGHYNLGRETFMVPFVWAEDGWPMIDNENGLVNKEERLPDLPRTLYPPMPQWDNFESPSLQMQWNTIHPPLEPFYSLTDRPGYLRLQLRPEVMEEICTPSFVGRRQRHKNFLAKTAMEFAPAADQEEAGIALVQDDRFHYLMTLGQKEEQPVLRFWKTENGKKSLLTEKEISPSKRLYLSVYGHTTGYSFYYGFDDQEMLPLIENVEASRLSSVVNNGFTGVYLGMYATSNHTASRNYADFDWFCYQGEL